MWCQQFQAALGSPDLLPEKPTAAQVDELAKLIHEAMQLATASSMKPREPYHPKSAPWWNSDCDEAAVRLRTMETGEDRK